MGSQFREQINATYAMFEKIKADRTMIRWRLREARDMRHDPIAHWEASGYVVEKRYGTRHQSELLGVLGICQRRNEAGEDVIMLLSEDEKHAIIMTRSNDPENRDG